MLFGTVFQKDQAFAQKFVALWQIQQEEVQGAPQDSS